MSFDIEFEIDTPLDPEESAKQEIANSIDATPGLAEAINGMTWRQIFKLLGYDTSLLSK